VIGKFDGADGVLLAGHVKRTLKGIPKDKVLDETWI